MHDRRRFDQFVLGHLGVSLLWSAVWFAVAVWGRMTLAEPVYVGTVAMAILSYAFAGWRIARKEGWRRPDRRESVRAVLVPACVAWGWGALAIVSVYVFLLGGEVNLALSGLFLALTWVLAAPSSRLGLLCLGGLLEVPPSLRLLLYIASTVFLAGLLPPLLFWLGSWLGAPALPFRKAERAS